MRVQLVIAFVLFSILASSPAWAADVSVNCDAGESINAALGSLPQGQFNTLNISGTCNETVNIFSFTNLTLAGTPSATITGPNPSELPAIVSVDESRNIVLRGLTLRGSGVLPVRFGLFATNSTVRVENCLIENIGRGIVALGNSSVGVLTTTIQDTNVGVQAANATVALGSTVNEQEAVTVRRSFIGVLAAGPVNLSGSTSLVDNFIGLLVQGVRIGLCCDPGQRRIVNNDFGIVVSGGHVTFIGPSLIEGNRIVGLFLTGGSTEFRPGSATFQQNGLAIFGTNNARLEINDIQITNNNGEGIFLTLGSSARIFGSTINNNGAVGVRLEDLSVAELFGNTIRGNGKFSLFCSPNSHARGDLSNADKAFCPGFGRSPQPKLKMPAAPQP